MKKVLSTLALAGFSSAASALTVVNSDITSNTTWGGVANPGPIILEQTIFVRGGATLTILPGTIVRGQPRSAAVQTGVIAGSPGALIVTNTGRIVANGTKESPIIFTTAATDNNSDGIPDASGSFFDRWNSGDTFLDSAPMTAPLAPLNKAGKANVALWGGLAILGNAPTNNANKGGVGFGKTTVEGLSVPGYPVAYATYGGLLPHDNSGSLTYASIRHAGDEIGNSNELNGLTLAGVGDGTRIENIEIYCNFDDGIEWFGGTVNGKNLAVFFAGDDAFDLDEGYTGTNQFLFAIAPFFRNNDNSNFGSASGDKLGEFDGENFRPDNTAFNNNVAVRLGVDDSSDDFVPFPLSNPAVWNMTGIGKELQASPTFTPVSPVPGNKRGIQFRNGFAGQVYNTIVLNTGGETGFEVETTETTSPEGYSTLDNATNGLVIVASSTFRNGAALASQELLASNAGNALNASLGGTANVVNNAGFNGLINSDVTFNPTGNAAGKLDASLKPTKINPRPATSFTGVLGGVPPFGPGVDRSVNYRGAFNPSTSVTLWTTGWTALSIGGILAD